MDNGEWTVAVDDETWEEKFEYVWNLRFSPDGKNIAVSTKGDDEYGVALNGNAWGNKFIEARDIAISPNGKNTAACIQTTKLGAGDIFGFFEGAWTAAINGIPWRKNFLNIMGVTFSPDKGIH